MNTLLHTPTQLTGTVTETTLSNISMFLVFPVTDYSSAKTVSLLETENRV